ncbi:MAG: hypothetical protein M3357_05180, partial [Actinomycetota bacterium]|nr:hypothetical protein [Actinomycetota bacterium]
VVVGFVAGDESGYDVRVAGEGELGAGSLDRNPDGSFPHLLIRGWKVTRADDSSGPMSGAAPPTGWFQIYRDPDRGYDGAQVAIHTSSGDGWGVPEGARKVETESGHAVLYRSNDLQTTVVWSLDDGRTVVLQGTRVTDDDLAGVARGLRARPDRQGWEATVLPAGLTGVRDAATTAKTRYNNAEVTFARRDRELQLTQSEDGIDAFESLVDDRVNSAAELRQAVVLGYPAAVTRYGGSQRHAAMWFADGVVYELDGDAGDTRAFLETLAELRVVDDDTWEEALPSSAVAPKERAAEVDRMLADIPQPPGFDPAPLRRSESTSDRYQLGAKVSGAVACAWIDRWAAARRAGDDATVDEAVEAMATSRDWRVLDEMNDEGDYPEVLWQYADAMADDGRMEGGRPMSVEESVRDGLGCPR